MLLFGDHTTMPLEMDIQTVGFLTLKEGLPRIELEFPMNVATSDESEYDMRFAQFILNDDRAFIELMSLMFPLYDNRDIYVTMTKDGGYFEYVAESLGKFIQQRYGYTYAVINENSDYDHLNRNSFTFNINGLYNFDLDKQRYTELMMHKYPNLIMNEGTDSNGNKYKYIPEGLLYYTKY